MKKIIVSLLLGAIAGIIDMIPMILQKLSWDANISAFSLWIVSGFFIATSKLKIHTVLKGIIIPFLVLIPAGIIIGWSEPFSLLPIAIMTLILGSLLGITINIYEKKSKS